MTLESPPQSIASGPCDWSPTYIDCEGDTCIHLEGLNPTAAEAVLGLAATWLWYATMRRYGNCPVTILPCRRGCSSMGGWPAWVPFRTATGWVNVGCGRCGGDDCSCTSIDQIVLPTAGEVVAVELDGAPLTDEAWRVDNRRYLLRTDGGVWPTCQDLSFNPSLGESPSFAVTYIPGLPLPSAGEIAYGMFACQLARRACGERCELPANATAVTRQGVSILLDPGSMTGIWIIDQWVQMVNKAASQVWTPDMRVTRTVGV
jgi:hypothetical protein